MKYVIMQNIYSQNAFSSVILLYLSSLLIWNLRQTKSLRQFFNVITSEYKSS